MTKFNYGITDSWWVALQHGHSAFRLLKIAHDIETEYDNNRQKMNEVEYGRLEYLNLLSRNQFLTNDMFKISSASIALFQGMMEALINDAIETKLELISVSEELKKCKGSKFYCKWVLSLNLLNQSKTEFEDYFNNIYLKYRNNFIHPSKIELNTFNDLEYSSMYWGFKSGWTAGDKLFEGLSLNYDKNSWNTMLKTYGINEL